MTYLATVNGQERSLRLFDGGDDALHRFLPRKGEVIVFDADVLEDTELEGQSGSRFRCDGVKWNYSTEGLSVIVEIMKISDPCDAVASD